MFSHIAGFFFKKKSVSSGFEREKLKGEDTPSHRFGFPLLQFFSLKHSIGESLVIKEIGLQTDHPLVSWFSSFSFSSNKKRRKGMRYIHDS